MNTSRERNESADRLMLLASGASLARSAWLDAVRAERGQPRTNKAFDDFAGALVRLENAIRAELIIAEARGARMADEVTA